MKITGNTALCVNHSNGKPMICDSNNNEFWYHVADQKDIPLFGTSEQEYNYELLDRIVRECPDEDDDAYSFITALISSTPDSVDILRTLIGVSDKRMYLELSYAFSKAKFEESSSMNVLSYSVYNLKKHDLQFFKNLIGGLKRTPDVRLPAKAKSIVTDYLLERGLIKAIGPLRKLNQDELRMLIKALVIPKEVQQSDTKRRGHGAEWELAKLLNQLQVEVHPAGKHVNPMGADDPNVEKSTFELSARKSADTWSFDMIVMDSENQNKVFVQSLIHTSDPGQYGVNKSDETVHVKNALNRHNSECLSSKELWGLIDGVGFIENPNNTVFKMLSCFDTFVQLKSLYKAALRLHVLGLTKIKSIQFDDSFYSELDARAMFEKYGTSDIVFRYGGGSLGAHLDAGKARLYL